MVRIINHQVIDVKMLGKNYHYNLSSVFAINCLIVWYILHLAGSPNELLRQIAVLDTHTEKLRFSNWKCKGRRIPTWSVIIHIIISSYIRMIIWRGSLIPCGNSFPKCKLTFLEGWEVLFLVLSKSS